MARKRSSNPTDSALKKGMLLPALARTQKVKGHHYAFYSYIVGGDEKRKYIGKMIEGLFYPKPDFAAHPEKYPEPGTPEASVMALKEWGQLPAKPRRHKRNQEDGPTLPEAAGPINKAVGVTAFLSEAAIKTGLAEDFWVALKKVLPEEPMPALLQLWRQGMTCTYFYAAGNSAVDHLRAWTTDHLVPAPMMSGQRASELFEKLGENYAAFQNAFIRLRLIRILSEENKKEHPEAGELCKELQAENLTDKVDLNKFFEHEAAKHFLAFDGTKMRCESDAITYSQRGKDKDGKFRSLIHPTMLFSITAHMPVGMWLHSGNAGEAPTMTACAEALKSCGIDLTDVITVMDRAFLSRTNVADGAATQMGYLFGSKLNLKIVNDLITKRRSELGIYENFFVAHNVYGISEQVETAEKGPDGKKIKVYVHLFYDEFRKAKEMRELYVQLEKARAEWNLGRGKKPSGSIKEFFLEPVKEQMLEYNQVKMKEAHDQAGLFALVSTTISSASHALDIYKKRNDVECSFKSLKSGVCGQETARVHNDRTLQGKMCILFMSATLVSWISGRMARWRHSPDEKVSSTPPISRSLSYAGLISQLSCTRLVGDGPHNYRLEQDIERLKEICNRIGLGNALELETARSLLNATPESALPAKK